jgi:hypothetical protein
MNVYNVTIEPKAVQGAGIGHFGSSRTLTIVTGTLQEALGIARSKITDKEEVAGIYTTATDVVVDYSQVVKTS